MNKIITFAILLGATFYNAEAQMLTNYSQFNNNLSLINPAYSGLDESALNATFLYRYDRFGIKDSPQSQAITLDKRFDKIKVGGSINVNNVNFGNFNFLDISGNGAYHLDLGGENKLSFGMKAGISSYNRGDIAIQNPDDLVFKNIEFNWGISPKLGIGSVFKTENFHIGASLPDIIVWDINGVVIEKGTGVFNLKNKNINLNAAYKLNLSDDYFITPSILSRYSSGSISKTDINVSVTKTETFWAGGAFSPKNSVALMGGLYLKGRYKVSGAMSFNTTANVAYRLSGEVCITYDLEDIL